MERRRGKRDRRKNSDLDWFATKIEHVAHAIKNGVRPNKVSVASIVQHEIAKELSKIDELPYFVRSQIAWNMLLYLYDAYQQGQTRISKQLCSVSGAPNTTALRYIAILEKEGLIRRIDATADLRIVPYSLTPAAASLIEEWAARQANNFATVSAGSDLDEAK